MREDLGGRLANTSLVFLPPPLPLAGILGSDFMKSRGIGDDHTTLGEVKSADQRQHRHQRLRRHARPAGGRRGRGRRGCSPVPRWARTTVWFRAASWRTTFSTHEKCLRRIKVVACEPCTSDADGRTLAGAIRATKSGFGFQRIIRTQEITPRLLTISEHEVHVIRSGQCSPRIAVSQRGFRTESTDSPSGW